MDVQFLNVILLGISFFMLFTSCDTGVMIQQVVTDSINEEYPFYWNGYTSLCIVYAVFALANFTVPSVVSMIGPKYSMVVGASTNV